MIITIYYYYFYLNYYYYIILLLLEPFYDAFIYHSCIILIITGALSRVLCIRYPNMTAIEIDDRAVTFLKEKLPTLKVIINIAINSNNTITILFSMK